jgi:AraC family transcriptional regulator, transcriptional activator of pobA
MLITDAGMETVINNIPAVRKINLKSGVKDEPAHISIQRLNYFQDHENDKYYRIIWVLNGVESIQVGMEKFKSFSNLIVFVAPGKKINLSAKKESAGWILNLSPAFFSLLKYENLLISNADILSSTMGTPKIILSPKVGERVHSLAGMIDELDGSQIRNKEYGIISLVKAILVYCESRCNLNLNKNGNHHEIDIVSRFKELVVNHFTQQHKVTEYAGMMNITSKYLNQVVKKMMGVTAKHVIQEQLVIKARQDLKFTNKSIKEIAFELGFTDPFHFSNFFKEFVGHSPTRYRKY